MLELVLDEYTRLLPTENPNAPGGRAHRGPEAPSRGVLLRLAAGTRADQVGRCTVGTGGCAWWPAALLLGVAQRWLTVFLGRRSPADEDEGRTHGRVGTRGRAPHECAGCDRGPSERSAPAACWSVRPALSAQTQAAGTVVVTADGIGGAKWPAR